MYFPSRYIWMYLTVDGESELMKSKTRKVNKNFCLKRVRKGFREERAHQNGRQVEVLGRLPFCFEDALMWKLGQSWVR